MVEYICYHDSGLFLTKEMIERRRIFNNIIKVCLFSAAVFCIIWMLIYLVANQSGSKVFDTDNGWDIDFSGRQYRNVSIKDRKFRHLDLKRNETIVMKRKIDMEYTGRLTVMVYSRLSSVRVSLIDGRGHEKQVYYYGYNNYTGLNPGDFLGSGYSFVELPQGSTGKILKIMEMSSQNDSIVEVPEVIITPFNDALAVFVKGRSFVAFVSFYIFIAGALVILLSLFATVFDPGFFRMIYLGFFSICSSLWCMCSSKVVQIFSRDLHTNSMIEYMSLYLLFIPLLIMVLTCFYNLATWQKLVMTGSVCAYTGLSAAAIVLQKLRLVNVDYLLPVFHALMAFDAVFLVVLSLYHWKRSRVSEKYLESGIFVAAIAAVIYTLVYYADPLTHVYYNFLDMFFIPLSLLMMTNVIFIGYVKGVLEQMAEKAQRQRLLENSGTDTLTGLKDNIIGESVLRRISADKSDYVFIIYDLNGLRRINREKGSHIGDLVIKGFADGLRKVFYDADLISRTGGDEFFIVFEKNMISVYEIEKRAKQLEKELEGVSVRAGVELDAAYGYALSGEIRDKDTERALQVSKQRLYMMKTDMNNQRSGL